MKTIEPEDNECCSSYNKCKCKTQNIATLTKCDLDCEDVIDTPLPGVCGKECGFIKRTCKPKDHCKIDGKRVEPGQSVSKKIDPCTTCYCPAEADENGLFKAVCNTQCCGDCAAGYSRIPQQGQCCGKCMPLTCTDSESKPKAVGETWSPVDDKCITCTCKNGDKDIYAECFSTRQVIVGDCPEEFIERSEDGCVEICTKNDDKIAGCGLELDYESHVELTIDGEECKSTEVHRMTMCTGGCASNSIVKGKNPEKSCNCCSATETESKSILFKCGPWNQYKTHTVNIPTACSCNTSKCEDKNENLENEISEIFEDIEEEEEEDDDKNIIEKAAEKVVEEVKDTAKSVWGKIKSWSPWG